MGKKLTTELFIEKSIKHHGYKYDYSKTIYKNNKEKVIIICPIHGEFLQSPSDHTYRSGCWECGMRKKDKNHVKTTEYFLKQAKKVHGNKYDYSQTVYTNYLTKIKIICPIHGEFYQIPGNHLRQECPDCAASGWTRTDWVNRCIKNKIGYLYVIRCYKDGEQFIKIGITSTSLKRRFNRNFMPYEYEVINIYVSSPNNIWNEEKRLHKLLRKFKYKPLIKFGGSTECFSMNILPISFS